MTGAGPVARAAELAALGHRGSLGAAERERLEQAAAGDPDPRVRATALAALVRAAPGHARDALTMALDDPAAAVRRRAAELTPELLEDLQAIQDLIDGGYLRGQAIEDASVGYITGAIVRGPTLAGRVFARGGRHRGSKWRWQTGYRRRQIRDGGAIQSGNIPKHHIRVEGVFLMLLV